MSIAKHFFDNDVAGHQDYDRLRALSYEGADVRDYHAWMHILHMFRINIENVLFFACFGTRADVSRLLLHHIAFESAQRTKQVGARAKNTFF